MNTEAWTGGPRPRAAVWLVLLVLVLLAGLSVRWLGIRHGDPDLIWHPDVAKQAQVAANLFDGDLDLRAKFRDEVKFTLYPYGAPVLLATAMHVPAAFQGRDTVRDVHRWVWALRLRWLASLLLLSAVLAAFWICRAWLTLPAAMLAGVLLVWEPSMALDSHYGMNDVPLAAMVLLAWIGSVCIPREGLRWPWVSLLTGLALGVGFGIKYQAALAGLFPLAAVVGLLRRGERNHAWISLAAVAAAGLAGVLWTSPMLRDDPAYFLHGFREFMAWQANILGEPLPWHQKMIRNAGALSGQLLARGHGAVLLLAAIASVRVWRRCPPWRSGLVSGWLFSAVLLAAVLGGRDIVRLNDLMPLWPWMLLMLGLGLSCGGAGILRDRPRLVLAAGGLVLGLWFGAQAWLDAAALHRPDTRERARAWCLEHVQPGEHLLRERYTLSLDKEGVRETSVRYLASREGRRLIEHELADVLVASSLAHDRFFDKSMPYYDEANQQVYLSLTKSYDEVAVFTDRDLLFAHPTVKIYRLRPPVGL